MAYAAGRRIKRISKVSDTEDTEPSLGLHGQYSIRRLPGVSVRGISDVSELASIPQTILIEKEVKVVFDLAD
jgi:hypothetical protein